MTRRLALCLAASSLILTPQSADRPGIGPVPILYVDLLTGG